MPIIKKKPIKPIKNVKKTSKRETNMVKLDVDTSRYLCLKCDRSGYVDVYEDDINRIFVCSFCGHSWNFPKVVKTIRVDRRGNVINHVKKMEMEDVEHNTFGRIDIIRKNRWMCKECGRVYNYRNEARDCSHNGDESDGVIRIENIE